MMEEIELSFKEERKLTRQCLVNCMDRYIRCIHKFGGHGPPNKLCCSCIN